MFRPIRVLVPWCALVCWCALAAGADDLGVRVPDGFEVSLYADDALAHDIFSMTVDARGRVVVAGPSYVKILHDDDRDGRADRATLFSTLPASGAHGMVFDGPDLICTGDNSVMRLRDSDGDSVADGPGEVWTSLRHPEHGANGLVRGPDGCYWLICGNDAGVSEKQITFDGSPVKHPRCGAIVRFASDGRPLDVYAHGFRNPYDLDFDGAGHLLTVDSDGERDHHLPWYAPTRLFDVAAGMEHGWLEQGWMRGWNRPQSFFDSVERAAEIGRGSPTGVVAYRHRQFPAHYRGGVFTACWTLGRVYYFPLGSYFPLDSASATCRAPLEIFMQTTGDVGFAPCDLAIGPEGDLFVAIGGRRTRGSVFRVRAANQTVARGDNSSPLAEVLTADQPLASWSRARWVPLAKQLDSEPFEQAVNDASLDAASRVRAVEVLVELFGGLSVDVAERAAQSNAAEVRARVAWSLAYSPERPKAVAIVAELTADTEPRVARAAWESLARLSEINFDVAVQPDWAGALGGNAERRVRAAAIVVARDNGRASYERFLTAHPDVAAHPEQRLARLWANVNERDSRTAAAEPAFRADGFQTCLQCFAAAATSAELKRECVRLLQIGLGDFRAVPGRAEATMGYAGDPAALPAEPIRAGIVRQLAPEFPTPDAELNRELARLFGMLAADDDGLLPAISRLWTANSSVEDDVHYLISASLIGGHRTAEVTSATADCLLGLHEKLSDRGQFPSLHWPMRIGETFDELCRRDPALASVVAASPALGHAEHALFIARLAQPLKQQATRRLWSAASGEGREPTASMVALAARLPDEESRRLLNAHWDQFALRDAIVVALADKPRSDDRAKFVEALGSPQPAVVEKGAQSLMNLGMACSPSEMAAALRALKQTCATPKQTEPRKSLLRLLEFWTEGEADINEEPDPAKGYVPWFEFFQQWFPAEYQRLKTSSGADAATWKRRLSAIDFATGDVARGHGVFQARACDRCHQASGHLGPELKGAVSRMSRDDLFTAILDPDLEVSPAFQTTVIATNSGQVYHGLVVYESPEGTLLQTGPDTTVRVTGVEQSTMRKTTRSLMPSGLLDPLSDQEVSDLHAYLRSLSAN